MKDEVDHAAVRLLFLLDYAILPGCTAVFELKFAFWQLSLKAVVCLQCGLPSVPWHCWLGIRKSIRSVKNWVTWLFLWSEIQMICMWSSWCHCQPVISCFIKIQTGLTFLVLAYPGCPGKKAVKWASVCQLSLNVLCIFSLQLQSYSCDHFPSKIGLRMFEMYCKRKGVVFSLIVCLSICVCHTANKRRLIDWHTSLCVNQSIFVY